MVDDVATTISQAPPEPNTSTASAAVTAQDWRPTHLSSKNFLNCWGSTWHMSPVGMRFCSHVVSAGLNVNLGCCRVAPYAASVTSNQGLTIHQCVPLIQQLNLSTIL